MAIPKSLKDTKNYQLIGGLKDDDAAQELRFKDDRVKVTTDAGAYGSIRELTMVGLLEQILTTLHKIEYHLAIATDTNLNDQDAGG